MKRVDASTGSPGADAIAADVTAAIDRLLPGRIAIVCTIGGFAEGVVTPVSDLDLVVLLRDHASEDEVARAAAAGARAAGSRTPRLDLTVSGTSDETWEKNDIQMRSVVLVGQDIRSELPGARGGHVSDTHFLETVGYAAAYESEYVRRGARLTLPLGPPDEADEFLGYAALGDSTWYPPGTTHGTRALIGAVSILARGRIELRTRSRVATKTQVFRSYRRLVGDDWSAYLEELHERARIEWGYLVPSNEEGRRVLGHLCDTTLDFENESFAWMKNEVERLVRDGSNEVRKAALAVLPKLGESVVS